MLAELRFVQGAVAKKDFVPALTHFHIANGRVKGFNGRMALCSPIGIDLEATPKAVAFNKAIQACQDTVQLSMTPTGRLAIKSGGFKAFVECAADESFPDVEPEGELITLPGGLLSTLKVLHPFIAEDASRPWARGIMFSGQSAYATNNIVILERWIEQPFPVQVNIPKDAITEILRIGQEPTAIQVSQNSVTFHFDGDRWLRTQTFSLDWPDLKKVLDRECHPVPPPAALFDAVETLSPFVQDNGAIYFNKESISTHVQPSDLGASAIVPGLGEGACFNVKHLLSLKGIAQQIDFSLYPAPCLFYGDFLRGAIAGIRR